MPANVSQQTPVHGGMTPRHAASGATPQKQDTSIPGVVPPPKIVGDSEPITASPAVHAKNQIAELEKLRRYVKRGKKIEDWSPEFISVQTLDALVDVSRTGASIGDAIAKAKDDATAQGRAARKQQVMALLVASMTVALGGLVKKMRHGRISSPDFMDNSQKLIAQYIYDARMAGMYDSLNDLPEGLAGHGGTDTASASSTLQDAVVAIPAAQNAQTQGCWFTNVMKSVMTGSSFGAMSSQIHLYGKQLDLNYEQAYGATTLSRNPAQVITWHTDGGEICDLCEPRDGAQYTLDTLPGFPGDGGFGDLCEGAMNCKCTLTYKTPTGTETWQNNGRTQSIQDYAASQAAIDSLKSQVDVARSDFVDSLPPGPQATAQAADQMRVELSSAARAAAQSAARPLDAATQATRGMWN